MGSRWTCRGCGARRTPRRAQSRLPAAHVHRIPGADRRRHDHRRQVPRRCADRPRRHGRGVSRARPRLDRDVAVKVVRGDLVASAEARERFKREAQLAARLQHPAIVTVFDYGTLPDGAAYLVMEYVRGEDLRARSDAGHARRKDAFRLLAAIAEGVEAAHGEISCIATSSPRTCCCPRAADAEGAGFRRREDDAASEAGGTRDLRRRRSSGPRRTWRPSRCAARRVDDAPTSTAWR